MLPPVDSTVKPLLSVRLSSGLDSGWDDFIVVRPMSPEAVRPHHFVADVIYTPLETAFVKAAKARGARATGGGGMCVHQAVDAFRHFSGRTPDLDRMKRTFAIACARRGIDGEDKP